MALWNGIDLSSISRYYWDSVVFELSFHDSRVEEDNVMMVNNVNSEAKLLGSSSWMDKQLNVPFSKPALFQNTL